MPSFNGAPRADDLSAQNRFSARSLTEGARCCDVSNIKKKTCINSKSDACDLFILNCMFKLITNTCTLPQKKKSSALDPSRKWPISISEILLKTDRFAVMLTVLKYVFYS